MIKSQKNLRLKQKSRNQSELDKPESEDKIVKKFTIATSRV